MKDCHLVEDLWPLYEEGLVQEQTKSWIEDHVQQCTKCQHLKEGLSERMAIPQLSLKPEKTIAKTAFKLHVYQLLLVALSFIFAINTSLLSNKGFQFILTYFVLGIVVYFFYSSWKLTVLISFVPTFIWSIYDAMMSYGSFASWWEESLKSFPSIWHIVSSNLMMAVFVGAIHSFFAVLGIWFVILIRKAFEKEKVA